MNEQAPEKSAAADDDVLHDSPAFAEPDDPRAVDAAWLRDALVVGIHRVIGKRDHINRINVFPVADADTGTNLAFTLHAVMHGIRDRPFETIGELTRVAADLALDSARGNSGAIFAQYLQGVSEALLDTERLTPEVFAASARLGAQSARGAIAEPREGTMLSVLRDHALALDPTGADGDDAKAGQSEEKGRDKPKQKRKGKEKGKGKGGDQKDRGPEQTADQIAEASADVEREAHAAPSGPLSMEAMLARGLEEARRTLAATPEQLEVLRQHNVVDAGAQGFVEILEGMQAFAALGAIDGLLDEELHLSDDDMAPAIEANESEHRYCTECMITGDDIDRMKLREAIQEFGASSVVLAGTKRKVRVHVHVDNPGALFLLCEDFGVVTSQKADDMQQQQRSAHGLRRRVAIVTDTGADIAESELERLQIHLVPLRIHFGDRQFLDKVSLTPEEFYQRVAEDELQPRTSQPPPGDFRRQFEFLGSHFEGGVVCLSISAALSGTWQAAASAARRASHGNVTAFDTLNASAGQGLLTMYAAEAALAGADRDQVLELLAAEVPRTRTFAILPQLDHAVRGGRLPNWVRRVADLLRLTPVIASEPTGRIGVRGVLFGRNEIPQRFARWLGRRAAVPGAVRLLIAHCDNLAGARALRDQLVRQVPRVHSVYLTDAGTALGAHAGPGSLIVGVQPYRVPEDRLAESR